LSPPSREPTAARAGRPQQHTSRTLPRRLPPLLPALQVEGRGDKNEIFASHKFCITMENSNVKDYFTEKL
jgi:hypothetical protein